MPQDTCGSVTQIVISIRCGNQARVTPLWERYFERLTHHAAKYLRFAPDHDEDAALSAINDFCDGLARGRFQFVDRREVLWATLAKITERKAMRHTRGQRLQKEVKFTDLQPDADSGGDGVSRMAVVEPTKEYGEIVRIEIAELIDKVPNPLWREACRMVMEGYTVPEIAAKLGRGRECVYIWFQTIGEIWGERVGRENLLG
jgi:hypothetical protein